MNILAAPGQEGGEDGGENDKKNENNNGTDTEDLDWFYQGFNDV